METYKLVEIPTPMLASLFCLFHSFMDTKVPIHMSRLLLLTLIIRLKSASTLGAWISKTLIEAEDKMRSRSNIISR